MSLRLKVEAGLITEVETLLSPGDSKIVGCHQEDLTEPSRLWTRSIPARFGDPMGALSTASLPFDRDGKPQQAPDVMGGAAFVSAIFAVSQGRIA